MSETGSLVTVTPRKEVPDGLQKISTAYKGIYVPGKCPPEGIPVGSSGGKLTCLRDASRSLSPGNLVLFMVFQTRLCVGVKIGTRHH